MDLFFKDTHKNTFYSWDNLVSDLSETKTYNPYCKSDDYYKVFKQIVYSMLSNKEIILLDSDFTKEELEKLTGHSQFENFTELIHHKELQIKNKSELIEKLKDTKEKWKITLFTSGTTGIPKKVSHDFKSITRFVKYFNNKNIWGYAYNPTHMAGVQVFLQALLNGNPIVRLFGLSADEIHREITENKITHISATPTFYKLLLPCDTIFESVKRITSGGEKFNEQLTRQFKKIFPNAKITNVYASTEAGTLFASENDIFSIKQEYENLIRIENGELLIHNSLMGNSDISIKEWYNTEDLVEIISEKPLKFRFLSRKSDMINVGGYKVNPLEVEEVILSLSEIKNVRVYSKSNSVLGNIICCEVVCDNKTISESTIRTFLQSKIQEFKIPRIIRFVDEISTTRTGKLKRS